MEFCTKMEQKSSGDAAHEEDSGEHCSMALVEVSAFKHL